MNRRRRLFGLVLLVAAASLIGLMVLSGCEKKSSTADVPGASDGASAGIEQALCPVMGDAIDKDIFVEYKGKKVYLCCKMCVSKFEKNPQDYIAKLPQFK